MSRCRKSRVRLVISPMTKCVRPGTIPEMYEQGLRWLQSCLRRTQNGQSFNSIGKLEIPETVLEELLQNALVHLDLLKTAAIRLLIFDDRVEIINPGSVMGGHTMEEVMRGNSFPRNPLMANFCAKTMPYRGLGSGIPRVLSEDSNVEFVDDKAGNQFKAIVKRPVEVSKDEDPTTKNGLNIIKWPEKWPEKWPKKWPENAALILEAIISDNSISVQELESRLPIGHTTIKKILTAMQIDGILHRVDGKNGGHWEVIEKEK